jgi:pilus assembly protein CpaE
MIRFAPPRPVEDTKLRTLIASDDELVGEEVRELLLRHQPDCLAHGVVPIELVADRACHVNPGLVVLVLPSDAQRAYRAMREVAEAQTTHVLAVGPANDPKMILRTLHEGGAHEYLDQLRLEEEMEGALFRFRNRRSSPQPKDSGRVLSILSASGGSGASTLAVNLSVALAASHEKCGLVDLRLSAGDLAAMLDTQPAYGLTDLCENLDRLDQQMFDQFFERHTCGVFLLASPGSFSHADAVTPRAVRQAMAMARAQFPHVVVDLDNVWDEQQVEAVWQSDAMLLVLRLDYTSVRNAKRTIQHLQQEGIDANRLQLIANRVGERGQLSIAEAEQALERDIFDQIPSEPPRMNAAVNAGVPVVLHRPRSRVARRLTAIAARVSEYCARQERPSPP